MAHWKIVKQESVSGHNLDGTEQETGDYYVVQRDGQPVYDHEGFWQIMRYLNDHLDVGDRLSMDLEF